MLYICTHMATLDVKGLIGTIAVPIELLQYRLFAIFSWGYRAVLRIPEF